MRYNLLVSYDSTLSVQCVNSHWDHGGAGEVTYVIRKGVTSIFHYSPTRSIQKQWSVWLIKNSPVSPACGSPPTCSPAGPLPSWQPAGRCPLRWAGTSPGGRAARPRPLPRTPRHLLTSPEALKTARFRRCPTAAVLLLLLSPAPPSFTYGYRKGQKYVVLRAQNDGGCLSKQYLARLFTGMVVHSFNAVFGLV